MDKQEIEMMITTLEWTTNYTREALKKMPLDRLEEKYALHEEKSK